MWLQRQDERLIVKDLEGIGRVLNVARSLYLPGSTEESHENPSQYIRCPGRDSNEHLLNMSLRRYCYASLLSAHCLFNDVCNSLDYATSKVGMRGTRDGAKFCAGIWLEGLRKTKKSVTKDNRYPVRHFNLKYAILATPSNGDSVMLTKYTINIVYTSI
jgi:hypothetical protein